MAPNRRLYDLSENVVPAQGAEAIADTPSGESSTDSTSGERNETQTDPTSLDSNPYDEGGTRTPDHRVDVTTLANRRAQAKRSVPPRLSNNEFANVIRAIDKVSVSNPEAAFSKAVVAGVESFSYRNNRNALNVLAAVVPILIKSGNFDQGDRNDLLKLNQRVASLRRQADGSFLVQADLAGATAGGDVDPTSQMSGGLGGADSQSQFNPLGGGIGAPDMGGSGGDPVTQQGGGDSWSKDPSGGGAAGGGMAPGGVGPTIQDDPSDPGIMGNLGNGDIGGALGDLGSDIFGDGGTTEMGAVDPSQPATGPLGGNPHSMTETSVEPLYRDLDQRTARIAAGYLRSIRAGTLSIKDLSPKAQWAVRRLADDSGGGAPSYDPTAGGADGSSMSSGQSSALSDQAGMGGYTDPAADSTAAGMGGFPSGESENSPMAGGLGGDSGQTGGFGDPTSQVGADPSMQGQMAGGGSTGGVPPTGGLDPAAGPTVPGVPSTSQPGPGGTDGTAGQITPDTATNPNAGGDSGAGGDTSNPGGVAGWAQDVAQGAGNAVGGLGSELGDIGSGISDAVGNLGDIPNAMGQGFQNGQATSSRKGRAMNRLDARTARIASRYAKLMLAGHLSYKDLNPKAQEAVSAWMRTADDDSDSGSSTDNGKGVPGKDENTKDNRQNPHGDGGNDEGMLSAPDQGEYGEVSTDAEPGGPPVENVPDNIKSSQRRRRLQADDNMDVAQKDTDSVNVEAPVNNDTSDDAQASQFDRSKYDQNGPLLDDPDKSTDQNWPPKASAVDSIRLADMYVDLGLIPAEKKYEVVAGFESMSSIIVKDRLRVLAVVAENAKQNGNRREAATNGRTRSMVPQSGNEARNGRMPQFGRQSSIKGNTNNGIDTHFLAL